MPKRRNERYVSRAYRQYLKARELPKAMRAVLILFTQQSRQGFASRFLGNVPKRPVDPDQKRLMELYSALPIARAYDRRVRMFPVEPQIIHFITEFQTWHDKQNPRPSRSSSLSAMSPARSLPNWLDPAVS